MGVRLYVHFVPRVLLSLHFEGSGWETGYPVRYKLSIYSNPNTLPLCFRLNEYPLPNMINFPPP